MKKKFLFSAASFLIFPAVFAGGAANGDLDALRQEIKAELKEEIRNELLNSQTENLENPATKNLRERNVLQRRNDYFRGGQNYYRNNYDNYYRRKGANYNPSRVYNNRGMKSYYQDTFSLQKEETSHSNRLEFSKKEAEKKLRRIQNLRQMR